jgi:hypothetical protein
MASLAEIRARITAQDNKTQNRGSNNQSDNAIYAHWNIDEGATATIRFLPDADAKNEFFWIERQVIKLPFNGVKGNPAMKQITVQVPCMEMYGENCPVLAEVRPWYKDETLKEMANKYWKKRTYIYQGLVRQNPLGNDKTPANPIRRFAITSQIQEIIKSSLMDPEIENLPTDYIHGLDFNIRKTPGKGGFAVYTTSSWARKETPLTEAEHAAIEAHGLFNLKDFLPKKPSEAEQRVIKEMFEASVDGRPYDNDKWGAYYRPYGLDAPAGVVTQSEPTAVPAVATDEDDASVAVAPVVVPTKATSSDKAQDILAQIRARQKTA